MVLLAFEETHTSRFLWNGISSSNSEFEGFNINDYRGNESNCNSPSDESDIDSYEKSSDEEDFDCESNNNESVG